MFGSAPSLIPDPVKQKVISTPVENVYWRLLSITNSPETVTVCTPTGSQRIQIPSYHSWFTAKHDKGLVYEPVLLNEYLDVLSKDDVYYDIGSRWGLVLDYVSNIGVPDEQLYGFEANPLNQRFLERNHGESEITITNGYVGTGDDGTVAIDQFIESSATIDPPTVTKIDVEGAEFGVLQGMRATLEDVHPWLYIEMHPGLLLELDSDQHEVIDYLQSKDYTVEVYFEHRGESGQWQRPDNVDKWPSQGDYLLRAM